MPETNLWKHAHHRRCSKSNSSAELQIVGLNSATHTLFARVVVPSQQQQQQQLPCEPLTVEQVLELILNEVLLTQRQNQPQEKELLPLDARDLLGLGSVWKLAPKSHLESGKLQKTRLYSKNTSDLMDPEVETTLRVHFRPNRFPIIKSLDWTWWSHKSQITKNNETDKPLHRAVIHLDTNVGYVVVHKPNGLPSHATVDNGIENILYQLERHHAGLFSTYKPNLPQRLDVETDGLLLVSIKPEFSSYIGRLLQQKSTQASTVKAQETTLSSPLVAAIHKRYKCLLCLDRPCRLEELIQRVQDSSENGLIKHYMDPKSAAPKTFRDEPPRDAVWWLLCALRVLRVSPIMTYVPESNHSNSKTNVRNKEGDLLVVEVDVELVTGRTHQIRGQFAAMNLPLVGDPLYGRTASETVAWNVRRNRGWGAASKIVERLGLQCCFLSFSYPQWSLHPKSKRKVLVESGSTCKYQLEKTWWNDCLREISS